MVLYWNRHDLVQCQNTFISSRYQWFYVKKKMLFLKVYLICRIWRPKKQHYLPRTFESYIAYIRLEILSFIAPYKLLITHVVIKSMNVEVILTALFLFQILTKVCYVVKCLHNVEKSIDSYFSDLIIAYCSIIL